MRGNDMELDSTVSASDQDKIDTESPGDDVKNRDRAGRKFFLSTVSVFVVALAIIVLLAVKWRSAESELSSRQQADQELAEARDKAAEYAIKTLTYDFNDTESFFKEVESGAGPQLVEKYSDARDLLRGIMIEGSLNSKAKLLLAEAKNTGDNDYSVTVCASQTTTNIQRPTPETTTIVLAVTLTKDDDRWVVSDIKSAEGASGPLPADNGSAPLNEPDMPR
ncbi:MAG: hypothetical protein ACRCSF_10990 [Mycobacteriaceae bacterium]